MMLKAHYCTSGSFIPPLFALVSIHESLKAHLDISDDTAKPVWATFGDLTWVFEGNEGDIDVLHSKYIKLFMEHDMFRSIGTLRTLMLFDCS
jgi:hypothetical protein